MPNGQMHDSGYNPLEGCSHVYVGTQEKDFRETHRLFFWSALMTASITLFGCGDTSSNNVPSETDTTPSGGLSMQQVQGGMSDSGDTAGQTADENGGVVADDKCQPEATDYPGDDWDMY